MGEFMRELWWLRRDPGALLTLVLGLLLAAAAVTLGSWEVAKQRDHLAALTLLDGEERAAAIAAHADDPGGEAYYSFHLTYAPPSDLAFAALGTRTTHPWQHRVRMLALEGQIYETDLGNPELAVNGHLDFAFIAAMLLPLLVIALLHDLYARERRQGRFEWLVATAHAGEGLFRQRAVLRAGMLWGALTLPFLIGAVVNSTPLLQTLVVAGLLALHIAFWSVLSMLIARRVTAAATVATVLVGIWAAAVFCLPPVGAAIAERSVTVPSGGTLLLAQREKVNDAWDLPKQATMTPFLAEHPQWNAYAEIERPFEWKWYYAFQQVGDQTVAAQSQSLRAGLHARDRVMARLSLLSPPLLVERSLEHLAHTDVDAYQSYDACVRDFHRSLREHFYPALFREDAPGPLPTYSPCDSLVP